MVFSLLPVPLLLVNSRTGYSSSDCTWKKMEFRGWGFVRVPSLHGKGPLWGCCMRHAGSRDQLGCAVGHAWERLKALDVQEGHEACWAWGYVGPALVGCWAPTMDLKFEL